MGRTTPLGMAVIALAWLVRPVNAFAECVPTVVSTGDPALVQRLSERLAATGIAMAAHSECPATRVQIDQRGEVIHVVVTDAFGRRGEREVHDVATAASIVESWLAQEVEAGSLPPLAASASAAASSSTSLVATAPPSTPRGGALALALESSAGGDGSLWLGAAATGCVALGPACVGGLVRLTRDAIGAGDSGSIDHTTDAVDALVTIGLPRRVGGFTFTPGIGIGYGYHRLVEHHRDAHMNPIEIDFGRHALRADLHVSLAHAIGGAFAVFVDVRGDTALLESGDVPYGATSFIRLSLGLRLGGGD